MRAEASDFLAPPLREAFDRPGASAELRALLDLWADRDPEEATTDLLAAYEILGAPVLAQAQAAKERTRFTVHAGQELRELLIRWADRDPLDAARDALDAAEAFRTCCQEDWEREDARLRAVAERARAGLRALDCYDKLLGLAALCFGAAVAIAGLAYVLDFPSSGLALSIACSALGIAAWGAGRWEAREALQRAKLLSAERAEIALGLAREGVRARPEPGRKNQRLTVDIG